MKIFLEYFEQWMPEFIESLEGVTEADVARLEKISRQRFPDNYREFLLTMGKGDLMLWQRHRLEEYFGFDEVFRLQKKSPVYFKNFIRIGLEQNTGSETYLNIETNEIHSGEPAYGTAAAYVSEMLFSSFEQLLFAYGLRLVFVEYTAIIRKRKQNSMTPSKRLLDTISKIAIDYGMEEAPFTSSEFTKGFVCDEASIYVDASGVQVYGEDLLIEEIVEKTSLKEVVR